MAELAVDPQARLWLAMVDRVRRDPRAAFEEQWRLFSRLAAERPAELGPMPAWWPAPERIAASNIGSLMREVGAGSYAELHRWSVEHRAEFWRRTIDRLGIAVAQPPSTVLDDGDGPEHPRWLPGARLNIVDSCFRASMCTISLALGREGSDAVETVSSGELEALVNRVANGLIARGLAPGRGIALYMPMTLECVAAYLGVIRAGSFVISIADSFAVHELARRLSLGGAQAIVTAVELERAGKRIPLFDKVIAAAGPPAIVIPSGERPALRHGDRWWEDLLGDDTRPPAAAVGPATMTNLLFSSGTTGDPKLIPWDHLTPIKAAADGHYHHDIGPGSVVAWPTNIGWMMGPWLIYASLINRACMALYDGAPNGAGFARFVERAGVSVLGVVPSLVAAWRASGAADTADWSRISLFSSTGEPSNRPDYLWLMSRAGYRAPVIEYCGGTEVGGGYITGTVVQPASPATFSTPALGLDLVILDDGGREAGEGVSGEAYLVPPTVGLSQTLLNRDHHQVYYAECPAGPRGELLRRHGDQMERLAGGYFRAHGRADDTMNLGGIKVSSVELETVLGAHPAVAECAAVAIQPEGEGADRLVVFAVLGERRDPAELERELGRLLAVELNPLFKVHDLVVVEALPRTASNKLMRRSLRAQYLKQG
jgi:acetyl-CoA synthetase